MNNRKILRIAGIIRESIVDGPGIRFTIFSQGCPHQCKGCHNKETHAFNGGYDCHISKIINAIDENPLLKGVTFSGGEPACQPAAFYELAEEIKKRNLDIVMFSGYTFQQLNVMRKEDIDLDNLLNVIDILIEGPYIEAERDLTLLFRGSKNQRVLDMSKSNCAGEAVILENY